MLFEPIYLRENSGEKVSTGSIEGDSARNSTYSNHPTKLKCDCAPEFSEYLLNGEAFIPACYSAKYILIGFVAETGRNMSREYNPNPD